MRNCFFEDNDFSTTVRLHKFFQKYGNDIFIEVCINRWAVVEFVKLGVLPKYDKVNDIFTVPINFNSYSKLDINGIKTSVTSDKRLFDIPVERIVLKELGIKRYSKNTDYRMSPMYATRAVFKIKLDDRKR